MDGGVMKELHRDPTVGLRSKVWARGQKWKKWCQYRRRAREAQMRDYPEGGDLKEPFRFSSQAATSLTTQR